MGNVEGRVRWLELLKAINVCLPSDQGRKPEDPLPSIPEREELHVTNLECQQMEDVSQWYTHVKPWVGTAPDTTDKAAGDAAAPGTPEVAPAAMPSAAPDAGAAGGGPRGSGWIVQLSGYHYHNASQTNYGAQYVRNTLMKNLRTGKVKLPTGDSGGAEEVTMQELGISDPVLVDPRNVTEVDLDNPNAEVDTAPRRGAEGGLGIGFLGNKAKPAPAGAGEASAGHMKLKRFDFTVQFCWQPTLPTERREKKKAKEQTNSPAQP